MVPWLAGRASWPARLAAFAVFLVPVIVVVRRGDVLIDNRFVVAAARAVRAGVSPYEDVRFLYLPTSAVAALAETLVAEEVVRWVAPFVIAAMVLGAWVASLAIHGVSAGSRLAALGLVGIAYLFGYRSLLTTGNWSVFAVAAFPVVLLLASRGRWVWAAVVGGVSVAFKPMLAPLVLMFASRWRALLAFAGVPVALVLLSLPVIPDPGRFFTVTVPFIMSGQDAFARPYDASAASILPRLGVPGTVTLIVRIVVGVAGLVVAWRIRGRVLEAACLLMVTVFLVSTPSFGHYSLVVLLPLAASVVADGSVARSVWFWIALIPQTPGLELPGIVTPQTRAFSIFFLYVVLWALLLTVRRADHDAAGD